MSFYTSSYHQAYKLRTALKENGIKSKVTKKLWNHLYHKITITQGSPAISVNLVMDICRKNKIDTIFTFI